MMYFAMLEQRRREGRLEALETGGRADALGRANGDSG
jgi:hypothetical protein